MKTSHPITPAEFRQVLGHLPTGVTVITADCPEGPIGMSANSVTSVSLDPPLILFCAAKSSTTWPSVRAASRFCVNVMASHQTETALAFARRGVDRFNGVAYRAGVAGPALVEASAWLECSLNAEHDAGDHIIVVADVVAIEAASQKDPLVFFRGAYGSFRTHDDQIL
jgi:3-hydroxy-9,10-secoandrosta-1,3,5(10)-triene-9,17-dione monooxygenase reductase component